MNLISIVNILKLTKKYKGRYKNKRMQDFFAPQVRRQAAL